MKHYQSKEDRILATKLRLYNKALRWIRSHKPQRQTGGTHGAQDEIESTARRRDRLRD